MILFRPIRMNIYLLHTSNCVIFHIVILYHTSIRTTVAAVIYVFFFF